MRVVHGLIQRQRRKERRRPQHQISIFAMVAVFLASAEESMRVHSMPNGSLWDPLSACLSYYYWYSSLQRRRTPDQHIGAPSTLRAPHCLAWCLGCENPLWIPCRRLSCPQLLHWIMCTVTWASQGLPGVPGCYCGTTTLARDIDKGYWQVE